MKETYLYAFLFRDFFSTSWISWIKYKKMFHCVSIVVLQLWWRLKTVWLSPKPSLKIRTANAIFCICLGIFRECGLKNIFFRNETFLFFKIASWNFQHLFEKKIRETSQNFNSIRQPIEKMKKKCLNRLNELKFW